MAPPFKVRVFRISVPVILSLTGVFQVVEGLAQEPHSEGARTSSSTEPATAGLEPQSADNGFMNLLEFIGEFGDDSASFSQFEAAEKTGRDVAMSTGQTAEPVTVQSDSKPEGR